MLKTLTKLTFFKANYSWSTPIYEKIYIFSDLTFLHGIFVDFFKEYARFLTLLQERG